MHLAGELLIARKIRLAGPDAGLVLRPDGLGYPLNLDLHLRNLPYVMREEVVEGGVSA